MAPGAGVLLVALAVAASAGCSSAGQLHDAGKTRPVTVRPSPQQLWPAADVSPLPSASPAGQPSPAPVPGVVADGESIRTVDVPVLLDKDPSVQSEERTALTGCAGCAVRPAQYRDLTGDGREELLTAVVTGGQRAYLHVYTLRERQVLPVLALQVLTGFSADTVGPDLLVHEPTNEVTETNSTYRWNGVRLAFDNRQIRATGPAADVPGCLPTGPAPELRDVGPSAQPTVAPAPGGGSGRGDSGPAAARPSVAAGARPTASPSPVPQAPSASPVRRS
ncbi:hypothetical protein GCM10010495_36890 [Kitasatospora herbaricolor]|uniref:hypothetical protein n=1 Tax=Kitasatospora herbaricolor TaxID=68217 RepID=UPI001748B191|nr:hypothetical protein [Kitasatospora herbaricolor]MDQ0307016.1 hypothetical protein [Kitasatospora herbaricolor]GGV18717.1 hypothetical protein GCM10010495_36890 [Kitasatospora herbaricolor]